MNEVELSAIYNEVFTRLKIDGFSLQVNSRKILAALAEYSGGLDKMIDITIAIDKLDKIGLEKVKEELSGRGLSKEQVDTIGQYLLISGSNAEKLGRINELLGHLSNAHLRQCCQF